MADTPIAATRATRSPLRFLRSVGVFIAVILIRSYQLMVRPLLIGSCKFYPSCSEYAVEAFRSHGLLRGLRLSASRLARCHPFSHGGIDPVPLRPESFQDRE